MHQLAAYAFVLYDTFIIRGTEMISRRLMVIFTWLNGVALPLLFIIFPVALVKDSDFMKHPPRSIIEYVAMVLIVYFLMILPVTAPVALILNRRIRLRPVFWINAIVISFWVFIALVSIVSLIRNR